LPAATLPGLSHANPTVDRYHPLITGLGDAGADDYVIKPYKLQELTARIPLYCAEEFFFASGLEWGSLRLNSSTCDVTYKEQPVQITPKESFTLCAVLPCV